MRNVVAAVVMVSLQLGPAMAQNPAPAPAHPRSPDGVTVVGCLVRAADGFLLKQAMPLNTAPRRSRGSNSAKSSTPVSTGTSSESATSQRESAGSNSPKSSTPIRAATSGSTGRRTRAVTTAKGSVPLAGPPTPEATYHLVADPGQHSLTIGQLVEVSGTVLGSESTGTNSLKVDRVKMLSSSCPQ
jgi:hypothetical protein